MKKDKIREEFGFDKSIPILDPTSENFKEDLAFNIWSTFSSSDYRNDRERPYNGQPHTDHGERGKTEVRGLTLRDICDCLIIAMLKSSPDKDYLDKEKEFLKCWDYSTDPPKPTQYLLDMQKQGKYISTKADTGDWRYQDVYKINWNDIDPLAIVQNMSCEIEKMMGIFPNISNIKSTDK
jgi:hypothetical protein